MNFLKKKILANFKLKLNLDLEEFESSEDRSFIVSIVERTGLFKLNKPYHMYSEKNKPMIENLVDYGINLYHPIDLKINFSRKYVHENFTIKNGVYFLNIYSLDDKVAFENFLAKSINQIHSAEIQKIGDNTLNFLKVEKSVFGIGKLIKKISKANNIEKDIIDGFLLLGNFPKVKDLYKNYQNQEFTEYFHEMSLYCSIILDEKLYLDFLCNEKIKNTEQHARILYFLLEYYKVSHETIPDYVFMSYSNLVDKKYQIFKALLTFEFSKIVKNKKRFFLINMVDSIEIFYKNGMKKEAELCFIHLLDTLKIAKAYREKILFTNLVIERNILNDYCGNKIKIFESNFLNASGQRIINYIKKIKLDILDRKSKLL